MHIQLTELEIELLEEAARPPSRLRTGAPRHDPEVLELLLRMQLIVHRDGVLEITILGQHVLKLARGGAREEPAAK